jgi:glycosyltransferase involved in cell wall biosynthesis
MKVLHLSTWKIPCGIATYCQNLVHSLEKQGIDNEVFPLHPSEWQDMLPCDISEWEHKVLKAASECDLVHFQHEHGLYGYSLGSRFACKRFGSVVKKLSERGQPFVTTFHTDLKTYIGKSGLSEKIRTLKRKILWGKYVAKYFGPTGGQVIVHNASNRKSFAKHGFDPRSIHVINHPCLPTRELTLSPEYAKEMLGYSPTDKIVSIFGFVERYKGHEVAVETLKLLPKEYKLAVIGGMHPENDGNFLNQLLSQLPPEVASRVRVTGWVSRETADQYFAATDICLAPYRGDTILAGSGAVTWALSSGKPVIASKIPAFQSVNRLGECMFMVTPDKPWELSWAIQKIANEPTVAKMLVDRAADYCRTYSWDASLIQLEKVYRTALGNGRGAGKLTIFCNDLELDQNRVAA